MNAFKAVGWVAKGERATALLNNTSPSMGRVVGDIGRLVIDSGFRNGVASELYGAHVLDVVYRNGLVPSTEVTKPMFQDGVNRGLVQERIEVGFDKRAEDMDFDLN